MAKAKPAQAAEEKASKEFIEALGVFFSEQGAPRMAGRVMGLLVVTPKDSVSSSEICRELKASKASVSTMARLLVRMNTVEKVSVAGERQDHYKAANKPWTRLIQDAIASAVKMQGLAERTQKELAALPAPSRRLGEIKRFYDFLLEEMKGTSARWEAGERRKRR